MNEDGLPADTDYLCSIGGVRKTHFTGGPDKGQPFDPAKLGSHERGYATYNGHPVTTRNCDEHTDEFIETARKFAHQRHKKYGTAKEQFDRREQTGQPIERIPEDEEGQ